MYQIICVLFVLNNFFQGNLSPSSSVFHSVFNIIQILLDSSYPKMISTSSFLSAVAAVFFSCACALRPHDHVQEQRPFLQRPPTDRCSHKEEPDLSSCFPRGTHSDIATFAAGPTSTCRACHASFGVHEYEAAHIPDLFGAIRKNGSRLKKPVKQALKALLHAYAGRWIFRTPPKRERVPAYFWRNFLTTITLLMMRERVHPPEKVATLSSVFSDIWGQASGLFSEIVWHRAAQTIEKDTLRIARGRGRGQVDMELPSRVAWSSEFFDCGTSSSTSSTAAGADEPQKPLPVWRIAADPQDRPLVWVAELVWSGPDQHCMTGFASAVRENPRLENGKQVDALQNNLTKHHRLLAHLDVFHGMPEMLFAVGSVSTGRCHQQQAPENDARVNANSPVYLLYALAVHDVVEDSTPHATQSTGLDFVSELLQKPAWTAEDAARVMISTTQTVWTIKDAVPTNTQKQEGMGGSQDRTEPRVKHFGIAQNPVAKHIIPGLGVGELSLKLHGFGSAFVLQDIAPVFFPNHPKSDWHMLQEKALGPMLSVFYLYLGFLAGAEAVVDVRAPNQGPLHFNLAFAGWEFFADYKNPKGWVAEVRRGRGVVGGEEEKEGRETRQMVGTITGLRFGANELSSNPSEADGEEELSADERSATASDEEDERFSDRDETAGTSGGNWFWRWFPGGGKSCRRRRK